MSETLNNIISFDYSVDPTTLMSDIWITTSTDTAQNTVTGVGERTVTHYWRTITFEFTGKSAYAGVFRIEVDEHGVPVSPYNFESISGDEVTEVSYMVGGLLGFGNVEAAGLLTDFPTATENTTYTEKEVAGTWSYVASTTTGTDYDHYEVELYVNSDATTFTPSPFNSDENITSIEFDTYSITSFVDGGVLANCLNLTSAILPNNLEYIGASAFYNTPISQITLPSTLEEIGVYAFYGTNISQITLPSTLTEIGDNALNINNLSITSLATVPPTIHTQSISNTTTLTIHETALQSYINSDWSNYVTSISTIETPTYDNVLKFDYRVDPTSKLDNLWVNSCTDTEANTIEPVGEHTEQGYMSYSELNDLRNQWTPKQGESAEKTRKSIDNAGGLSPYLISMGWTSEEVNEFMSIYDNDSISAYVTCYIETGSEVYEDIMAFIETTVTTYDHYEVTLHLNSAISSFESLMFAEDTDILSVEFPASITYIGDDAFNGCTSLASVTMNQPTPPTLGDDVFKLVSATLFVPEGSIQIYRQELGGTFPTIKPIKLPANSFGFNLSRMGDVDYARQGVVRRY